MLCRPFDQDPRRLGDRDGEPDGDDRECEGRFEADGGREVVISWTPPASSKTLVV
jgi:hypothetical protein